ncbi:GyrI-like domain-containing protein [Sporolactobacillus shoreicorticis]|uniref:GyrI-like domain-containing protein n=1 Tax=Sporolactobacillus shoreicorticis TaxID=1923877 RepID=A0ABW5S142_9BACL|nr:GyrI-like domain-containing protein [Sporolactobacillus shoreicorticis]MCO7125365.1 GyrI-like domain-containing protein [Sporolactobacillus shoreicorticis]
MSYEVVQLEEKTVAGLKIRTSNDDANMGRDIGALWENFLGDGVYQTISTKKNENTIGLYTNYESDVNGTYDVMVCCEVEETKGLTENIKVHTIPAGRYAKFIVRGNVQTAVGAFWAELWSMDLDRKYSCDFEEYQGDSDMNHAEIHVYISLNELGEAHE